MALLTTLPRRRRSASASAAALILTLASAAAAEWDDLRKKLDRYEAQAKDMHQRAQQQIQQLEKDARALLDRWASEVVGKPRYHDGYGQGCAQRRAANLAPVLPPNGVPMETQLAPPVPAVYYTRAQFDAWEKVFLGFFAQAQKVLDANQRDVGERRSWGGIVGLGKYNYQIRTIAEYRRQYDQVDKDAARFGWASDRKARAYWHDMSPFLPFYPVTYRLVISVYSQLLYLENWEITGNAPGAAEGGPPPPGQTCLIMADASNKDFADQGRVIQAEDFTCEGEKGRCYARHCDLAPCMQVMAVCAENEQQRRDVAASQFRPFVSRFYVERAQIRDRMLQWRKDCISAGLYDGTGDAAISAVYGTEANLSTDNVYGFHPPVNIDIWWEDLYDLELGRGDVPEYLSRNNTQRVPSGLGNVWSTGSDSVLLDSDCVKGTLPPEQQVTAKYPDLESKGPFTLSMPSGTPMIREGIASGAARSERP